MRTIGTHVVNGIFVMETNGRRQTFSFFGWRAKPLSDDTSYSHQTFIYYSYLNAHTENNMSKETLFFKKKKCIRCEIGINTQLISVDIRFISWRPDSLGSYYDWILLNFTECYHIFLYQINLSTGNGWISGFTTDQIHEMSQLFSQRCDKLT